MKKKTLNLALFAVAGGVVGYVARPALEPKVNQLLSRFKPASAATQSPAPALPSPATPADTNLYPGGSKDFDESGGADFIA